MGRDAEGAENRDAHRNMATRGLGTLGYDFLPPPQNRQRCSFTRRRVSSFQVARDCADILATGQMDSGVYTVHVNNIDIDVNCDMTTEAGGWLVTYTFI